MGISNIGRTKSEGTDWITRAGRALHAKPLWVMGDATPTQFTSCNPQTAQLAPAINRNQSDPPRTGRPFESRTCSKRLSGPRTASSSASNVIAAHGRFD